MDKDSQQNRGSETVKSSAASWITLRDAGAVVAIVLVVGIIFLQAQLRARSASGAKPIDGVRCDAQEGAAYHIHSHLEILGSGRNVTVPADVGIPSGACLYWLHTHDDSGVIHVEAPKSFRPTLGAFFDIWHQPLSRRRVAGVHVTSEHSIKVFVNLQPYRHDPRGIRLRDHLNITIEVGPPFKPPSRYDFAAAGL